MKLELGNVVKFTDDLVKIERLLSKGFKEVKEDVKSSSKKQAAKGNDEK